MDSGPARTPYSASESAREDPPAAILGQSAFSVGASLQHHKPPETPIIWLHSEGESSWSDPLGPLPLLGHQLSSSLGSDLGGAPITPLAQSPRSKPPCWSGLYSSSLPNTDSDDSDGGIGFDIEMDPVKPSLPFSLAMDEDDAPLLNDLGARPPPTPPRSSNRAFGLDGESDSPMDMGSPLIRPSSLPCPEPFLEFSFHNDDLDGEVGDIVFSASAPAPAAAPAAATGFESSLFGHDPGEFAAPILPIIPQDDSPVLPGIQPIIDNHHPDNHTPNLPTFLQALAYSTDYPMTPQQQFPSIFPVAETDDENTVQSSNDYVFAVVDDEAIPQSPNDVVFDNEMINPDLEKYNPDFGGFCEQLWNLRVMCTDRGYYHRIAPPHISSEGARIAEWASTRPQEVTAEDVARGRDMQGIEWDLLELPREAARRWRQFRYVNYRNLATHDSEQHVSSSSDCPP